MPKAVLVGKGNEKMPEVCEFPSETKGAGADDVTVSTDSVAPKRRKGGRPKGSKNKTSKVAREAIAEAEPERFLIRVMKGQKFMRAADEGAKRRTATYPTLTESTTAARTLLSKIIPDLKSQELSGPDGVPLIPDTPQSRTEIARRLVYLLSRGGMVPSLADGGNVIDANVDNNTDADESPPGGPSRNPCPPQSRNSTGLKPPSLVNDTPSELVSPDPEIFSENSDADVLTNDGGDAEADEVRPPAEGHTRQYGDDSPYSIRCDPGSREGLPPTYALLRRGDGELCRGPWQKVTLALSRLVGDVLPSFKDSETGPEVPEFAQKDQRVNMPAVRPSIITRRRRR